APSSRRRPGRTSAARGGCASADPHAPRRDPTTWRGHLQHPASRTAWLPLRAMSLDPRTPVLVGAAAVSQRFDDPQAGRSAIALMAHACEEAAADAGNTDLLRAANVISVPTGTWKYPNAAGAIAQRLGNTTARAVRAELGILQTTLFRRAADAIARGDIDVALVVG